MTEGKGSLLFIICFVLFWNQCKLTAFLFTSLLMNNGKEMSFCKFFLPLPPTDLASSELNWNEPLAEWMFLPSSFPPGVSWQGEGSQPSGPPCSWGRGRGRVTWRGLWADPAPAAAPPSLVVSPGTSHSPALAPVSGSEKWVRPQNLPRPPYL